MKHNAKSNATRPLISPSAVVAVSAAICPLLAGCTISPDDMATANARNAVESVLKAPGSAKFGDIYVVWQPASAAAPDVIKGASCGTVNAKNDYGGMAGPARFVVTHQRDSSLGTFDDVLVEIEDPSDRRATVKSSNSEHPATIFEELYWNRYCITPAHPPTFTAKRGV